MSTFISNKSSGSFLKASRKIAYAVKRLEACMHELMASKWYHCQRECVPLSGHGH